MANGDQPGAAGERASALPARLLGVLDRPIRQCGAAGRIGELARVAVLARDMPRGTGATGRLLGSVFAHRLFDLFPALILTGFVLATAKIPRWAITSLEIAIVAGIAIFLATVLVAGLEQRPLPDGARALRKLLAMARLGLNVMREPVAAVAALPQTAAWAVQLYAVWATMFAFGLDLPLSAAAVLLLMNVATIFPLWPGNIGLVQAVVALPLVSYGVPYATGIAFGLGLQVIEMSVGIGLAAVPDAGRALARDAPDAGGRAREARLRRRGGLRALAAPAGLKGVLSAREAAARSGRGAGQRCRRATRRRRR